MMKMYDQTNTERHRSDISGSEMNVHASSEKRFYMSLKAAGYSLEDARIDVNLQRMYRAYTGREWCEAELPEISQPIEHKSWQTVGFRLIASRDSAETTLKQPLSSNPPRKSSPAPHTRQYRIPPKRN